MREPERTIRDAPTETSVPTVELERILGELPASAGRVTVVHRSRFPYRSTHELEELTVRGGDGSERRLVFKDLGLAAAAGPDDELGFRLLHDPRREIDTYRRLLHPEAISAPALLGVEIDPDRDRHWLFLERVEGRPLWQVGDPETWRRAAAWLAGLHGRFAGRRADLPGRLLSLDSEYFRQWLERARESDRWRTSPAGRDRDFGWLAGRVEGVLRWLDEQPTTFLHGEFYASNVLVERRGDARTAAGNPPIDIRPVDWEMAATGPGLLDLAALASGGWTDRERRELAEAYRAALPEDARPSAAGLEAALDRCRLLVAVQWLGWAPRWDAPPEHRHDWLSTAVELAERIEPTPPGGRRAARRLNWGCGGAGAPGWINSDRREGPRIDIVRDIREGLPLEDGSVDYAVSIHALPEVPYADLVPVLEELRRVLVPGGVLRLGLPDLDRAMRAYLAGDTSYFLVPDEDASSLGGKLVTQVVWYGYSRTPFTFDFAAELLESAGFGAVHRCAFGETASRFPGIVELDDRERESLFVEAVR